MLLAEVLIRRDYIKYKIAELKNSLLSPNVTRDRNEIRDQLFTLMDEYQRYAILINKTNNSIKIEVADSELTLANAVRIRENLDNKMNVLSGLIEMNKADSSISYDVLELMKQRDKLMEEYIILSSSIFLQDWRTEITQ
jgi:hypothetical protein